MTKEEIIKIERETQERPYRDGYLDASNGHLLMYSMDIFGSGPERCEYFVLRAVDDASGKIVAMSYTPTPDPMAEREFRLDFLVGGAR